VIPFCGGWEWLAGWDEKGGGKVGFLEKGGLRGEGTDFSRDRFGAAGRRLSETPFVVDGAGFRLSAGWIGGNRSRFERKTDLYRPARPAGADPG
jgi:hypothetical protein